jgi:hypothetical protein
MRSPTASGIARVAYEATRAYSSLLGHVARPDWPVASPRQRRDALLGVQAVLSGEARSGALLHELWIKTRAGRPAEGSVAQRYAELAITERRRILLFRAVVLALVDGPCSGYSHDQDCPTLDDHDCHLDTCVSRFGIPPGFWRALLGTPEGPELALCS